MTARESPVARPRFRRPRYDGARAREAAVVVLLLAALLVVASAALVVGEVPTTPGEVWSVVTGTGGGGDPRVRLVVVEFRLPRVVVGALAGLALGASGSVFQSLTRNPLGSPDVVGFTAGSATGAILGIVLAGGGSLAVALFSVAGGVLCAALVLALVASAGSATGHQFVLVGIGVSAVLTAFNGYLLTRASLGDATAAQTWLVGSLNGRGWEHALPLACALLVLLPVAMAGQQVLTMMEMGDVTAIALGVGVPRARLLLVLTGVALTAAATAAAGPIAFVALAAPQLARRLTRGVGPGVTAAAVLGALLLVASDLAAQRLLAPIVLPVGVLTGLLGGGYLAWLLWVDRGRPRGS
ncbi:iron chelate uptake ABC transporter family permease subunit [Streptomyces sp. NBRC 109706]|uniref:FecCD family ABC transporter permease n=1 Tax=Streptomyces sp. NBRC 109706 TaxID=1550035 RepID=UPI0007811C0A|nr:iron chelate uptake ABC transporter family permease subunit [Streptomyces sp. NBRC 109706]